MKFIVLATDGIWEYIDNEEVCFIKFHYFAFQCVNIVGKFFDKNDLEGACDCLLNEAYKRWTYVQTNLIFLIFF